MALERKIQRICRNWRRFLLGILIFLIIVFFFRQMDKKKMKNNLEFEDPSLLRRIQEFHLNPPADPRVPYNLTFSHSSYSKHDLYHGVLMKVVLQMKKTRGFFVEAGALDGEFLSHTMELEKAHDWTGLLVEASPRLIPQLKNKNRRAWVADVCLTDKVYDTTEFLTRRKLDEAWKRGSGKVVPHFDPSGTREEYKPEGKVDCFSLYSLLKAVNVTKIVDLLVLDIEGGEFKVIKSYPFHLLPIKIIAVEYWLLLESPDSLVKFLKGKGYRLEYRGESDMIFILN
ncbi:unnamed protein product [Orchesella dallaii]|uniref:Methyltransferase FkbM domain-containing protein n=1 Tax=Orchesella dallaii TaxID=48710 RepID=A0ABP1R9M9_9HEXA